MIVVAIIGILALIAVPNFMNLRARAYNSSAQNSGRNAKMAEELYFQLKGGEHGYGYTNQMSDLLQMDRNLLDDPMVQWRFGDCNLSGYTFTTWHPKGATAPPFHFVFTD